MATPYDTWLTYDAEGERAAEREEAIERITDEYRADPKKLREAEEWTAGSFDGEHYTEISLALYALHNTNPDKLLGSDLLATLYRLAKVDHEAIDRRLNEMAGEELERQQDKSREMRDHYRHASRAAA